MRRASPPLESAPPPLLLGGGMRPSTFAAAAPPLRNALATEDDLDQRIHPTGNVSRREEGFTRTVDPAQLKKPAQQGSSTGAGEGVARLSLGAPRARRGRPGPSMTSSSSRSPNTHGNGSDSTAEPTNDAQRQEPPTSTSASAAVNAASLLSRADADAAVRATDSDALISRLSALDAGYLSPDPYAALFLANPPSGAHPSPSKPSFTASSSSSSSGGVGVSRYGQSTGPSRQPALSPSPVLPGRAGASSPPPFASPFARPAHDTSSSYSSSSATASATRRPPVLNIGTYLRCTALDRVIGTFLEQSGLVSEGEGAHIISVGAGSDSRYWRLHADERLRSRLAHYTELDFRDITRAKVRSIQKSPVLSGAFREGESSTSSRVQLDPDDGCLTSEQYSLFSCDLRTLTATSSSPSNQGAPAPPLSSGICEQRIQEHIRKHSSGESRRRRTLVLAECVLAYLEPRDADALLNWFASLATPSIPPFSDQQENMQGSDVLLLSFDMTVEGSGRGDVEGGGRFGRMMLQNIESRGLPLHGARAYSTPSAYTRRYQRILSTAAAGKDSGDRAGPAFRVFTGAKTLTELWNQLPSSEKARISRLEMLDEVEELEMLMDHYCISWGALESVEEGASSSDLSQAGHSL
ncbi:hypothetical protein A4X13_0g4217 [Tilletia indica]|uniref:Leucine carboxyl methyltransferase 1 n=1 Tax=Tilletia indica TaxID=43049 RepID=A0A177TR60_9BASI|nr:hypothetical protein A4X13_0g4217 [Tilletia indica]